MKSICTLVAATAALFAASTGAAFAAITDPFTVPEPGSLALVAIAIAGVALVARKKK